MKKLIRVTYYYGNIPNCLYNLFPDLNKVGLLHKEPATVFGQLRDPRNKNLEHVLVAI